MNDRTFSFYWLPCAIKQTNAYASIEHHVVSALINELSSYSLFHLEYSVVINREGHSAVSDSIVLWFYGSMV